MFVRAVLASLLLLALTTAIAAADAATIGEIIKKEGQIVITDGSSYYRFDKNGSFESGPLGMSGRTIQGEWKADGDYAFVIEGVWGWVNGISAKNDRRRLRMTLQPPFTEVPAAQTPPLLPQKGKTATKLYTSYALIDELVKLKSGK